MLLSRVKSSQEPLHVLYSAKCVFSTMGLRKNNTMYYVCIKANNVRFFFTFTFRTAITGTLVDASVFRVVLLATEYL